MITGTCPQPSSLWSYSIPFFCFLFYSDIFCKVLVWGTVTCRYVGWKVHSLESGIQILRGKCLIRKKKLHLCLIAFPQYLPGKMAYGAQTHIVLVTVQTSFTCRAQLQILQIQQYFLYFPGSFWMFSHAIWHGQCCWPVATWMRCLKIRFDKLWQKKKAWLDKNSLNLKFHNQIQTMKLTDSWKFVCEFSTHSTKLLLLIYFLQPQIKLFLLVLEVWSYFPVLSCWLVIQFLFCYFENNYTLR